MKRYGLIDTCVECAYFTPTKHIQNRDICYHNSISRVVKDRMVIPEWCPISSVLSEEILTSHNNGSR